MAKNSGTTRASTTESPRGMVRNITINGQRLPDMTEEAFFSRYVSKEPGGVAEVVYSEANPIGNLARRAFNRVYNAFTIQRASYNNPDLMELQKTPGNNWRLYYNGRDTGTTIDRSVISESIARRLRLYKG